MSIHPEPNRRRALGTGAVAGALLIASLGFAADQAKAATTAHVQAGTLQITGNGASDTLAVTFDPATNRVLLDVGEDGTVDFSFDRSTFTAIDIAAGGGNDDVRVGNAVGPVTIDGGAGSDTLTGGDGADTIVGGAGNDTVTGGRGNDVVQLGSGNDTSVWNPGDGSDTIDGQDGRDALAFNGSNVGEKMDVSANGPRVRLFRDVGNVTMDLGGIETLNVKALGGADTVTVGDLTGTALKHANVDLSATGGAGDAAADTVIVNGTARADRVHVTRAGSQVLTTGLAATTTISGSEAANDRLQVNTLGGKDTVSVASDVGQLITPAFDLGADQ